MAQRHCRCEARTGQITRCSTTADPARSAATGEQIGEGLPVRIDNSSSRIDRQAALSVEDRASDPRGIKGRRKRETGEGTTP